MSSSEQDPNAICQQNGQLFGLDCSIEDAKIVALSVPWDATTSYSDGTHLGPQKIIEASYQVDLFSPLVDKAWELPLYTLPLVEKDLKINAELRQRVLTYKTFLEQGESNGPLASTLNWEQELKEINAANQRFHQEIYQRVREQLQQNKKVILMGGDHSTSWGAIKATSEVAPISILHIDAHADLRNSYMNLHHSHASIMFNALHFEGVQKIVQVGIRDYSASEWELIQTHPKLKTYFYRDLAYAQFQGQNWHAQCEEIIKQLGENVYLSFDIDGLDPKLCPNTGTPVPGGLAFYQVLYLLELLEQKNKKLIGADLVEVAPNQENPADQWNANVGARLLFSIALLLNK